MDNIVKLKPINAPRSRTATDPATVMAVVVGAGGIGARIVPLLAKLLPDGSHIKVIDDDIVEERNCLRQPFTFEDIGVPKAVVMQERYDGRVNVSACVGRFQQVQSILFDADVHDKVIFLLGCVDNTTARYQMLYEATHNIGSYYRNYAYIDAGNDGTRGQVVTAFAYLRTPQVNEMKVHGARLWPDVFTPKMKVNGEYADPEIESCDRVDTQTVMANQMAATLVGQYVQMYLTGGIVGNLGATFDIRGGLNIRRLWTMNEYHTLLLKPEEEALTPDEKDALVIPVNYDGMEFTRTLRRAAIAAAKEEAPVMLEPVPEPVVSTEPQRHTLNIDINEIARELGENPVTSPDTPPEPTAGP